MLYLFDLDGTLISGYLDNPDKAYHRWHVLPGRVEKLRELLGGGNSIAVITNQGGVAFGFVGLDTMRDKLIDAVRACGIARNLRMVIGPISAEPQYEGTVTIYVCFHDTRGIDPFTDPDYAARRKPSPAMLHEAIADYPNAAAVGVLMVGDRPEDEEAAKRAGVSFQWAHAFFVAPTAAPGHQEERAE